MNIHKQEPISTNSATCGLHWTYSTDLWGIHTHTHTIRLWLLSWMSGQVQAMGAAYSTYTYDKQTSSPSPPHIPPQSHSHRDPPLHSYISNRHQHRDTRTCTLTHTHTHTTQMQTRTRRMTETQRERRSECCFHSDFSWSTTEQNEQAETPADPELFNEDRLHLCKRGCTWARVCLCVCRPSWSTSMLFRLKTPISAPLSCGMLQWLLGNYPDALFLCSQHH